MIRWLDENQPAVQEPEEEYDDYVVVRALIFRDGYLWETQVCLNTQVYENCNSRELIAFCIKTFEQSIDTACE